MSSSTTPLNFAPYSDPPPILPTYRVPPIASSSSSSYQAGASPSSLSQSQGQAYSSSNGGASGLETTLQYDLGYLAATAYALGPLGAAALLVTEVENDYVRFHAWQSALLSGGLILLDALIHLIFRSSTLLTLVLLLEIGLLILLARRAYRDADLLDRYYLPGIGPLAERWVAEE